tara:strand:- start:2152 stop:3231 length:1080 start_codon:yes stop_codon:yes gene_type:complete
MFSSNDTELKEILLEKLLRGEHLGIGWKSRLNWLKENEYISEREFRHYRKLHNESAEKANSELAERQANLTSESGPKQCSYCGDVINAGTYGFIFNSNKSPFNVIKGSIHGHSITYDCPADFEHEVVMHGTIYPILQEIKSKSSNLVNMLDIKDRFLEYRRCYYEMDKIFPYVIDEKIVNNIQGKKGSFSRDEEYLIETFLNMNTLTMLTPGFTNKDYFSTGGNKYSSWFEIGENKIKMLFSLLNISYDGYCDSLVSLLQSTLRNNIMLIDVEFILGSVYTGEGYKNGIFMIDFDKVKVTEEDVTLPEIDFVLKQDMFPDMVINKIKQQHQLAGKKRKSKKKKSKKRKSKTRNKKGKKI